MVQYQNAPVDLLERRLQIAVLIMFMGLSLLGGSSISGSLAAGSKASISSQASVVRLLGFHPDDPHIRQAFVIAASFRRVHRMHTAFVPHARICTFNADSPAQKNPDHAHAIRPDRLGTP